MLHLENTKSSAHVCIKIIDSFKFESVSYTIRENSILTPSLRFKAPIMLI